MAFSNVMYYLQKKLTERSQKLCMSLILLFTFVFKIQIRDCLRFCFVADVFSNTEPAIHVDDTDAVPGSYGGSGRRFVFSRHGLSMKL